MKEIEKDGIIFIEDSDVINVLQFMADHTGCSVIFKDYNRADDSARVIAYADNEKSGIKISKLFEKEYKGGGYLFSVGMSNSMIEDVLW